MVIDLIPMAEAAATSSTTQILVTFAPLVLIIVFFYFFIIRPQRNQEKKDKQMRDSLEIGDEVVTNGGIVGIVFQVKEDTVVIETGGDRSKIRVKKWAIAQNLTTHEDSK